MPIYFIIIPKQAKDPAPYIIKQSMNQCQYTLSLSQNKPKTLHLTSSNGYEPMPILFIIIPKEANLDPAVCTFHY